MFRTSLYFRLSGFYFWYFAFVGAFAPYFALYLQSFGYSPFQIATLMAVGPLSRIYGHNLWGWLADRTRRRDLFLRWLSAISAAIFCVVFLHPGFAGMLLLLVVLNLFLSGILPLAEASTMALLGERVGAYGRIRLWGSVGFVLVVMAGGGLFDAFGIRALEPVTLALLVFSAATTFLLPRDRNAAPRGAAGSIAETLARPGVLAMLAGFFLMQVAHGPYNTFYSIFLVQSGYSKTLVGGLWAFGVVAEIVLFMYLPRLLGRWSVSDILCASVAVAAVRFLMIAWGIESLLVLILAQLMHAVTFGAFHAAGIAAVHRTFRGRNQARGQAIYTSLGYGVGGSLGTLAAGFAWERVGGAWTFSLASLAAVAALYAFSRTRSQLG
jgi:MFS transporter, PPP family, 3-phenylpropionic acid transporter